MTNKSVSDYVAATMNAVLNSDEHKSLFANYKTASDENNVSDSLCAKCKYSKDSCTCGSSMSADDNDARTKQVSDEDSSDVSCADDDEASDSSSDSNKAEDKEVPMSSSAFDIAIDSLLTASAALDSVGFENFETTCRFRQNARNCCRNSSRSKSLSIPSVQDRWHLGNCNHRLNVFCQIHS